MQFDKQQILEMLRSHGSTEPVSQAEQDLPDQVATPISIPTCSQARRLPAA